MSKEVAQGLVLSKEDLLWARLKLAILKENFEYQEFFKEFKKRDKNNFPGEMFAKFGITGYAYFVTDPRYNDCIKLLDPTQEITGLKPEWVDHKLPLLFYSPAVVNIEVDGQPFLSGCFERIFKGGASMPLPSMMRKGMKPFERLFKVDLRKKKNQLLKEFKNYLDGVYAKKKQAEDDPYYSFWEQDLSRYREESWNHLEVWKLKKQNLSFIDIGIKLKITEDTAKKSFYRAYELTQGKKYDFQELQRKAGIVRKEEMERICATCPNRDTCTDYEICPDVLRYITQDELDYSREKLLKEDSDARKDYLFQKNLP